MELFQIWKKYNISLILVLPIFNNLTKNILSYSGGIRFPFTQLALEYGLINCFLYNNKCEFDGNIYLLFDRHRFAYNWKDKVKTKYWSMCTMMVDCKYYKSMVIDNDYIIVALRIPLEHYDSIKIIEKSNYYNLSFEYKELLRLKQAQVPITDNSTGMYIVTTDLPYAIAIKALHLKHELEDILGIELSKTDEFFQKFRPMRECYRPSIIRKQLKESNLL